MKLLEFGLGPAGFADWAIRVVQSRPVADRVARESRKRLRLGMKKTSAQLDAEVAGKFTTVRDHPSGE
jgi:hypothetical protein